MKTETQNKPPVAKPDNLYGIPFMQLRDDFEAELLKLMMSKADSDDLFRDICFMVTKSDPGFTLFRAYVMACYDEFHTDLLATNLLKKFRLGK